MSRFVTVDCNHTISLIKSIRHFLIVSHAYTLQTQTYTCHISTSYKHVHTQTHIIYCIRKDTNTVILMHAIYVQTTKLPVSTFLQAVPSTVAMQCSPLSQAATHFGVSILRQSQTTDII